MKTFLHAGGLALICGLLISCGKSEPAVEQQPTAAEQPKAGAGEKPGAEKQVADKQPESENELEEKANQAVAQFKETDPKMERFFKGSKGYAVFPTVGKGGFIVGGAHGKGVLYEKGTFGTKIVGTTTLTQGSIGLQVGGQTFNEIIFFQTDDALKRFKDGTTEFAGTASAVAASAGASTVQSGSSARYEPVTP